MSYQTLVSRFLTGKTVSIGDTGKMHLEKDYMTGLWQIISSNGKVVKSFYKESQAYTNMLKLQAMGIK